MAETKKAAEVATEKPLESITFEYNGATYVMEYNRRALEMLEKKFDVNVMEMLQGNVSISDLPNLFRCSLLMHHPRMSQPVIEKMYEMMADKAGLMTALVELAGVAASTVFEEPEEGKAISWSRH